MNTSKVYSSAMDAGYNLGNAVALDIIERILNEYEKQSSVISIKEFRQLIAENYRKYNSIIDKTFTKKEVYEQIKNSSKI